MRGVIDTFLYVLAAICLMFVLIVIGNIIGLQDFSMFTALNTALLIIILHVAINKNNK